MTSPTPALPSLQADIADLKRRIRTLEGGGGARGATADSVGAFAINNGSTTSTDWAQLWIWGARLAWSSLDFRLTQVFSAAGITATLRIIMDDNETLWTGDNQEAFTHDAEADLIEVTTDGSKDTAHKFAIEGKITAGTGTLFVIPEQLMMVDPY